MLGSCCVCLKDWRGGCSYFSDRPVRLNLVPVGNPILWVPPFFACILLHAAFYFILLWIATTEHQTSAKGAAPGTTTPIPSPTGTSADRGASNEFYDSFEGFPGVLPGRTLFCGYRHCIEPDLFAFGEYIRPNEPPGWGAAVLLYLETAILALFFSERLHTNTLLQLRWITQKAEDIAHLIKFAIPWLRVAHLMLVNIRYFLILVFSSETSRAPESRCLQLQRRFMRYIMSKHDSSYRAMPMYNYVRRIQLTLSARTIWHLGRLRYAVYQWNMMCFGLLMDCFDINCAASRRELVFLTHGVLEEMTDRFSSHADKLISNIPLQTLVSHLTKSNLHTIAEVHGVEIGRRATTQKVKEILGNHACNQWPKSISMFEMVPDKSRK
ncbi:hypothetical protein FB451DRAFT_1164721 [Mycena latifolia]|nr:hypothetical protein FB451DRAFT_1164721 [Mycena latifolia]